MMIREISSLMGRTCLISILLLLYFGCEKKYTPRVYRLSKDPIQEIHRNTNNLIKENFIWSVPKHWIPKDKGSLRLASYQIPVLDYFADLSVTKFGGDAGGVQANVNRWRKQLGLNPETLEEIQSKSIYGTSSIGKYTIYKLINNENPNLAFLCMILPLNNSVVFVKLSSTVDALEILEKEFNAFCTSFRKR